MKFGGQMFLNLYLRSQFHFQVLIIFCWKSNEIKHKHKNRVKTASLHMMVFWIILLEFDWLSSESEPFYLTDARTRTLDPAGVTARFLTPVCEKLFTKQALYCTFKERSDVPHVDAAGFHELTKRDLQEEDGDSSDEDDQQVGDQEDACRRKRVNTSCLSILCPFFKSDFILYFYFLVNLLLIFFHYS